MYSNVLLALAWPRLSNPTEQLPTWPDFMPGHAQTAQNIVLRSLAETKIFGYKYKKKHNKTKDLNEKVCDGQIWMWFLWSAANLL